MSPVLTVVISIVVLIVGIAIGYILRKNVGEKAIGSAEQQARNMILDAQNTVENLKKEKVLEAKEEIHKLREEYEGELKSRRAEVTKAERRILQKEENIDRKTENIERKEEALAAMRYLAEAPARRIFSFSLLCTTTHRSWSARLRHSIRRQSWQGAPLQQPSLRTGRTGSWSITTSPQWRQSCVNS